MPYIDRELRKTLEPHILALAAALPPGDAGALNFAVTRLVHQWLGASPRYTDYNGAVGVLESAKLELYRTKVSRYEDVKVRQHGPLPQVQSRPLEAGARGYDG